MRVLEIDLANQNCINHANDNYKLVVKLEFIVVIKENVSFWNLMTLKYIVTDIHTIYLEKKRTKYCSLLAI